MFKDKLKNFIDKDEHEGNDNKKIENLVFFIVLLIITVIIINAIWNSNKKSNNSEIDNSKKLANNQESLVKQNEEITVHNSNDIEKRLEEILTKISDVGEVKVLINYSESSEIVAMYNENSKTSTTEETDDSGGTRKIEQIDSQKDIIFQEDENGEKNPITKKTISPKIEGAIVIAKGANNMDVKTNIIQAVEAVTGLATHKIQVFQMN